MSIYSIFILFSLLMVTIIHVLCIFTEMLQLLQADHLKTHFYFQYTCNRKLLDIIIDFLSRSFISSNLLSPILDSLWF